MYVEYIMYVVCIEHDVGRLRKKEKRIWIEAPFEVRGRMDDIYISITSEAFLRM